MANNPQQNLPASPMMAICPHKDPCRSFNFELTMGSSLDQITTLTVPCGLIKQLLPREQEITIQFLEKLMAKHAWIENEREILRANVKEEEGRIRHITREIKILASPSAWLVLESEEFDYRIPRCVREMINQFENKVSLSSEEV